MVDQRRRRSLPLFASLIALIVVEPNVPDGVSGQLIWLVVNSVTLAAGVYAVSERKRDVWAAVTIAVAQVAFASASILSPSLGVQAPALGLLCLFYVFTLVQVLRYVLRPADVTSDTLVGAASVYLLAGLAWGVLYALAEYLAPGSFHFGEFAIPPGEPAVSEFRYFSFVTLTTLGYGDMTPIARAVRSFVMLEAVAGQFFLAVLVARLISLYRPQSAPSEDRA